MTDMTHPTPTAPQAALEAMRSALLYVESFAPSDVVEKFRKAYEALVISPEAPQAVITDEREAFETAFERLFGKRPTRDDPPHEDGYYYGAVGRAWKLWQVRAALAASPASIQPESEKADAVDAKRYRYMRNNATFRDRNGPGLYWYLHRHLKGHPAEQLDAAIDAAIASQEKRQ
jgi:hypothetical protein